MTPRYRVRIVPLLILFLGVPIIATILILGLLNAFDAPLGMLLNDTLIEPENDTIHGITRIVLTLPLRILFILLMLIAAIIVQRASGRIAGGILTFQSLFVRWASAESDIGRSQAWIYRWSPQRRETIQNTMAGVIAFSAIAVAIYLSISQFMDFGSMAVFATVTATALGYASRDYIGDLLAGLSNLFEDNLDVGEKIEVERTNNPLQGNVEKMGIRRASLRTPLGDRLVVPHGEIRVLRNFSRGVHSGARLVIRTTNADMAKVLQLLTNLPESAAIDLPDLLEPWKVQCFDGKLGRSVALEVVAKAPFGRGVALRLQMLTFLERYLRENGIMPDKNIQ